MTLIYIYFFVEGRLKDSHIIFCELLAGLVKSSDLLTPSEPDASSSAPNGSI